MDVAQSTISLTLFTFIFMVQYFAVYCSLQTNLMQVMCCSDRVIYLFFFIFLLFIFIFRTEKHIYFNNTREVPPLLF